MWIINILPASLTGIIIMLLFSYLDVLTFEEAFIGLGNPIIWLIISILILSSAMQKYDFDLHIAYSLLNLTKENKKIILLTLIFFSFILIFIIPSSISRLIVLLSINTSINGIDDDKIEDNDFFKSNMMIVTFSPYIGCFLCYLLLSLPY